MLLAERRLTEYYISTESVHALRYLNDEGSKTSWT